MLLDNLFNINTYNDEEAQVNSTVTINAAHPIFEGHFPENPVLPGVCMIQLIKELLTKKTGQPVRLTEGHNIKFLQVVNPSVTTLINVSISITETTNSHMDVEASIFEGSTIFFKLSATFSH